MPLAEIFTYYYLLFKAYICYALPETAISSPGTLVCTQTLGIELNFIKQSFPSCTFPTPHIGGEGGEGVLPALLVACEDHWMNPINCRANGGEYRSYITGIYDSYMNRNNT